MLDDKPVLYEAPEIPNDWDYDKSVDAMATRTAFMEVSHRLRSCPSCTWRGRS